MEITRRDQEGCTILALKGRLDGYWAGHFSKFLEDALHGGARRIRADLSELTYISSLGIRVLVDYYTKLLAIQGSFGVIDASERVHKVLSTAGLMDLLTAPDPAGGHAEEAVGSLDRPSAVYEVMRGGAGVSPGASMTCRAVGDPGLLSSGGYRATHCRPMLFPDTSLAVGLGAFGHGFEDCHNRFGEFLATGGGAAYQPTDGGNVADYLFATESLVAEVQVLYGLVCEGNFAHMAQFNAKQESGTIPLTELIADCLDMAQTDRGAIVLVAESAGLLGASLLKSPVQAPAKGGLFSHPEIRQWLSFTPEGVHSRAQTIVVGVAGPPEGALRPFLRPLGGLLGHFHAAAFSYRPLKHGHLDLNETVRTLFEGESLHSVLHLICDDRGGAGDSEFVRGACWVSPISKIISERGAA
jgi:anti-anti-sigma factor